MGSLRPYWQHLYSDSLSFYRLLLTECDDFALLTSVRDKGKGLEIW